jgi:formylglycine-generating enzyme required for sulfatase activity
MVSQLNILRRPKKVLIFVENLNEHTTLEMVRIPAGQFMMGAPESEQESLDRERPQHLVIIPSPFYMGRYPVTQTQWRAVAQLPPIALELKAPARFRGDKRPVERVTWPEALEFCARLSQHTGKNYRLPSEAEWEYACRAGTTTPFHFGETISTEVANYNGNYTYGKGNKGVYRQETTEVDYFRVANEFGLSDMHGNVFEWCLDPWHGSYKGAPEDSRVWDEENNENHYQNILDNINVLINDIRTHVLRGGSWFADPGNCRSAYRGNIDDRDWLDGYDNVGFRLVCPPKD